MHDPAILIMLVGLPAAGKTTSRDFIIEKWSGYFDEDGIVSSDDLIDEIAARCGMTYSEAFPDAIKFSEKHFNYHLGKLIYRGDSIVVDRTNLSVKSRAKILAKIPAHYTKVAVYFEIDEPTRQERLIDRPGKVIPDHVDQNMRKAYVRPTKDEGFTFVGTLDELLKAFGGNT